MANSPNQNTHSPCVAGSAGSQAESSSTSERGRSGSAARSISRTSTPTQYEFIMTTGEENATTARQKLKTVRSHVMKNYLQQQQQQRQGGGKAEISLSETSVERRKSKQRARSSRSASRESEHFPEMPEVGHMGVANYGIGPLLAGVPYPQRGRQPHTGSLLCSRQPFALDFAFNIPLDDVVEKAQKYLNFLVYDKQSGLVEPSVETLNAKVEIVSLIKEILGICGNNVPESIIFAVSLLAFGCAVDCEWDQAKGHLDALVGIVEARGGVDTVEFELQRTFTWTLYGIGGSLRLFPQFAPPLFAETKAFPLAFLDEAQIRAWRTVKRFPKDSSFVFDVVLRLHHLSLATSSEWLDEVDQRTLSNLYFEAFYHVLKFQNEEPWIPTLGGGSQGQEAAIMFRVWAAGLPLFIWATIRHVRNRLGFLVARCDHGPGLHRIREALDVEGGHHTWPRGKRLEPVLATMVYGIESCGYVGAWRLWVIEAVRKMIEVLKLKTVEEFQKTLDYFPCTEDFKLSNAELWRELMHDRSAASTPSVHSVSISTV